MTGEKEHHLKKVLEQEEKEYEEKVKPIWETFKRIEEEVKKKQERQ
ncbi:hypothetical protein P4603_26250 [Priestia aryabhattai]|nr:hypothetical protein [Priestia aryabhattai]